MEVKTELPALKGTEKQVAFAAQHRDRSVAEAQSRLNAMKERKAELAADGIKPNAAFEQKMSDIEAGLEFLKSRAVSAVAWLDHGRHAQGEMLAEAIGAWLSRKENMPSSYRAFINLSNKEAGTN